jgi:predicted AlkP superfamily phosphohydrolase/phosphomutase
VTARLLIVGLDGGTFDVLGPAMAAGRMPNLAALARRGHSATLLSTVPPVTPAAWTSFMTGKNPGKHGVYSFRPFDRNMLTDTFVNATFIRSRTVWQLLSDMELQVGVLNLPMTYPPYPVNGFMVSGFDTPTLRSQFTYPSDLRDDLLSRLPLYDFVRLHGRNADASPEKFEVFAGAMQGAFGLRTDAAVYLVERFRPDVFLVQYQNLDVLLHNAWGYLAPASHVSEVAPFREASLACLQALDEGVGRLVAHDHFDNADVLVVSDHGFGPSHGFIHANDFLEDWGYLRRQSPVPLTRSATPMDHLRDLLRTSSIDVIRRTYGLLGRWRWEVGQRLKRESTWLENTRAADIARELPLIWSETRAVVGMADQYGMVQIFGDDVERAVVKQELRQRFLSVVDPQNGNPLFKDVLDGATLYTGPCADQVDLVLVPREGRTVLRRFAEADSIVRDPTGLAGSHRPEGVLIACGPHVRSDAPLEEANLTDLAPTILHLMGGAVPKDMDGRVLTELLFDQREISYGPGSGAEQTEEHSLSPEEALAVQERLKALGYLG